MALINFPAAPTLNQIFTAPNGISYRWTGTIWVAAVRGMTMGPAAPANPAPGQLWWNSITGALNLYYFNGTTSAWVAATPSTTTAAGTVPIGGITDFAGAAAPASWLLCNGQSLATVGTYAALFAVIAYAYGGSGASFNVPDLQGRVTAAPDGGTGRLNITNPSTLGSAGGTGTVTLLTTHLPSHSHTVTDPQHTHSMLTRADLQTGGAAGAYASSAANLGQTAQSATTNISIGNTGSDTAHNNTQPTMVLNKIIRFA